MKETKQQVINRLSADNLALRTKLAEQEVHLSMLRSKLDEADIRAKRLIASNNRARSTEVSERRKAMEAARAKAMSLGIVAKVGG